MSLNWKSPVGGGCCDSCSAGICDQKPTITSSGSASAYSCAEFSYTITASQSPTSFGATGLPTGLSVNTSTGAITGRVRSAWSGTIVVSATNSCGTGTKSVAITIYTASIPAPTLVCDSISYTLNKNGYQATDGGNAWYLTSSWSGSVIQNNHDGQVDCSGVVTGTDEYDFSGSSTYDPILDSYSGSRQALRYQNSVLVDTIPAANGLSICHRDYTAAVCGDPMNKCVCNPYSTIYRSVYGDGICYGTYPAHVSISTGLETLSNIYTLTALVNNTIALLPSYPNTWTGANLAYRDVDVDEVVCTIIRFKYKFILPDLTGFDCYKIEWLEGTTPRSYVWNGIDTETGVYGEVMEPSVNGSIDVNSIVVTCSCS